MTLLGTEQILRRRYPPETRDPATGRAVQGAPTETTITASVQPLSDAELTRFPEGARQATRLKLYTEDDIRSLRQTGEETLPADEVVIDGDTYIVVEVDEYRTHTRHRRAYVERQR